MAKKGRIETNARREAMIRRYAKKRMTLKKALRAKEGVTLEERLMTVAQLSELPRNSSSVRWRRRCMVTGRPRGVYKQFGLSRIEFRNRALAGLLPGVKKASW